MSTVIINICPCCGGMAIVKEYDGRGPNYEYFTKRYAIQCEYTGDDQGCGLESGHYKTLEEAAEAWNRRYKINGI